MRGAGRVFKRRHSSSWWIAYHLRGKEIRESAASAIAQVAARKRGKLSEEDAKQVAESLLQKRLREIANDREGLRPFVGPQQDRMTVGELLDALEADLKLRQVHSLASIQSHLKQLRGVFGDLRAMAVTSETVDRYVETRLSEKEPPKPATVNRETGLLSQAFKLGVQRRRISSAPMIRKLSEKGNARQGFFEKPDFEKLVKHLPIYLQGFVQFGYHSGWRRGEISSLQWADVDMLGEVIRLRPENAKIGEGRVLALQGELSNIIARQWRLREYKKASKTVGISLYVFHRKGNPIGDIRKSWSLGCKAAKVDGKLFHDLRRTAVRNMIRAGIPERVAMSISGHKTRAIFDRYNIVSEDDLRQAMQRMQAYLNAIPERANVTQFPENKSKEKTVAAS